MNVQGSHGI